MLSRKTFLVATALLPFLAKLAKAEDIKEESFSFDRQYPPLNKIDSFITKAEKQSSIYHYYDIRELKDKYCLATYKDIDYFIRKEFYGKKVHLYVPCDICNGKRYNTGSAQFHYYASKIQCPNCLKYSKNRDGSLT
jgi:hypothetical protein